jgi:hypothetical protein
MSQVLGQHYYSSKSQDSGLPECIDSMEVNKLFTQHSAGGTAFLVLEHAARVNGRIKINLFISVA